jgi:nucleotide-binding universal stress UspA family protein
MTILFAYDGSDGAEDAMATAWKLLGHDEADAVVLSVWEPLTVQALRAERFGGPFPVLPEGDQEDEQSQQQAQRLAEHGARIAGEIGFEARALWVADEREIAKTIVEGADELDVDLIVLGARGLTGIRAFLGSVSNHVLQHAHRPVLVIPSKPVVEKREREQAEQAAT